MITTMDAPWSSSRIKKASNKIFALVALLIMAAGVASILGAKAQANGFDQCKNWSIVGDTHGMGISSTGLGSKLRQNGADSVDVDVYPRQSINDVNDRIKSKNFDGRCVIVEAGTGNLANDDGRAIESINRLLSTLSGAQKVYWVTPLASTNATQEWDTQNFLRVLNDTQASNLNVIDIQSLADKTELFDQTGVTMTQAGYEERINLILGGIRADDTSSGPGPSTPPSDTSTSPSPSPSPGGGDTPAPNPGGGGDTPAPNPGGGGGTSNPPPAQGPTSTGMTPAQGMGSDGFRGDPNAVSPLAFANRVQEINHFTPASDYLTLRRWGTPPIPTPMLTVTEPGSFLGASQAGINSMLFSGGYAVLSFSFTVATTAFSPGMGSTALNIADSIFGGIFGKALNARDSNFGGTGIFLGSLVMLSFLFAIIGVFSNPSQLANPRRALGLVTLSVGKYMVVIAFLLFMGWSSARNSAGTSVPDINAIEQVRDIGGFGDGQEELTSEDFVIPGNSQSTGNGASLGLTTRGMGELQVIDAPGSWHAFSLGWFVSWCYYIGNLVGQALVGIPRVITGTLFDVNTTITSKSGAAPSCDRYVDAMHLAFMKTKVADRNGGVADLLRTIDVLYYELFYVNYSHLFGGATDSSKNSWCVAAEVDRQTAGGDWLMLGRTAGLYKEAAGTGNLLDGNNMTYTDGYHRISDARSNIQRGLNGDRGGYLVNAEGNWVSDSPADAMPLRAEQYMGMVGNPAAANAARFHFAACEWDPRGTEATLNPEWAGVRAMGITGSFTKAEIEAAGIDTSTEGLKAKIDELFGKNLGKRVDKMRSMDAVGRTVIPGASGKAEQYFARNEELIGSPEVYYLQDYDCLSPRNFPIGAGDDVDKFGWGAGGPFPNRWDYSPAPPKQLAELLGEMGKDAVSSIPGAGFVEGILSVPTQIKDGVNGVVGKIGDFFDFDSDEGDGETDRKAIQEYYESFTVRDFEEDAFNRDTKFGSSRDGTSGEMPAQSYMNVSSGNESGRFMVLSLCTFVAALALSFLIIFGSIFGFVVNFMMAIVIFFLALILVALVGIQLFRFNRFGPNKKGA